MHLKVLVLFAFFPILALGQKKFSSAPSWEKRTMVLGYYGDQVSNPGVFFAYEYALVNNVKTKIRVKRGLNNTKYKTHRLELVPNLTSYWDPQAHIGIVPNLALQYKKVNNRRWMMNTGIGMGAFMNYLPEVFTVNDGQVSERSRQLNSYLAPSINWSFGRVKNNNGKLTGLEFGIRNHFLLGFNNSIQIAPATTIAYRF